MAEPGRNWPERKDVLDRQKIIAERQRQDNISELPISGGGASTFAWLGTGDDADFGGLDRNWIGGGGGHYPPYTAIVEQSGGFAEYTRGGVGALPTTLFLPPEETAGLWLISWFGEVELTFADPVDYVEYEYFVQGSSHADHPDYFGWSNMADRGLTDHLSDGSLAATWRFRIHIPPTVVWGTPANSDLFDVQFHFDGYDTAAATPRVLSTVKSTASRGAANAPQLYVAKLA